MMAKAAAIEATRVGDLLDRAAARLAGAGVPQGRRDARLLIAEALGCGAEHVMAYPERILGGTEAERAWRLIERRAAREPVSRILGRREFWGLPFRLSPATLDPRPDSETLVAAVLDRIDGRDGGRDRPLTLLDLGTGSGCLLLALLSELPGARGIGLDRAREAVATALRSARDLDLDGRAGFVVGDWAEAIAGRFNVILSNPPYVADSALADLEPEVARYDPRASLAAGADGLAAYRALLPRLGALLAPDGFVALEIGRGQAAAVTALAAAEGLEREASQRDLAGVERCLILAAGPAGRTA